MTPGLQGEWLNHYTTEASGSSAVDLSLYVMHVQKQVHLSLLLFFMHSNDQKTS